MSNEPICFFGELKESILSVLKEMQNPTVSIDLMEIEGLSDSLKIHLLVEEIRSTKIKAEWLQKTLLGDFNNE